MALKISQVFNKKDAGSEGKQKFEVVEPKIFTISDSSESYYRYLFPKNTEQPLTIPQKLVIDVVKSAIQKRDVRDKAVPRLPSVIPKLLRSLRDPDSSARHYVEIINKDPVMSAAVLKLGNSVYFNPEGKRINDIEPAVVKLGIEGLRSVLSAAVMQPIIQKDSAYFSAAGQRMWQHSLNTAVTCEIIAEHRKMEKFKLYLLGLVHDIGKTTIFSELCKQFKKNGEEVSPGYNAFVPTMKILSPAVSYWIAKDWELPKEICSALAEQTSIKPGAKVSKFAHLLYQANMATELYVSIHEQNENLASKVLDTLDLPPNLFETLDLLKRDV